MKQERRDAVKEMFEYPCLVPCPVINHVVVQLHNRPDLLDPIAFQEKLELLLCYRLAHVLPY